MSIKVSPKTQATLYQRLEKAIVNYHNVEDKYLNKGYVSGRITYIHNLWDQFQSNDLKLSEIDTEGANTSIIDYTSGELFGKFEEKYFNFLGELEQILETFAPIACAQKNVPEKHIDIKLPRIDIPRFDGEYSSWRSFHDMFISLIHNNNHIADVQKLHFLKSSVAGEAERILRQFDITDSNYHAAWDALAKRYENKRVLVYTQLKLLFNQVPIKQESDKAIRSLLDRTREYLHELNTLGIPTNEWDPIVLYILTQKLPDESRNLWEQNIAKSASLPKINQLFEFLEARFRTLEALAGNVTNRIPKHSSQTANYHINDHQGCMMCKRNHKLQLCKGFQRLSIPEKRTFLVKNKMCFHCLNHKYDGKCPQLNCKLCNQPHSLYKCKRFLNLTTKAKRDYVANKKLCFNCLSPHNRDTCSSERTCFKCGKRHNTLLHEDAQPASQNTTKSVQEATINCNYSKPTTHSLLATAMVTVEAENGISLPLRALIDLGSQSSFITEAAFQLLHTKSIPTWLRITGLGSSKVAQSSKEVELTLKSQHDSKYKLPMHAYVIRSITSVFPPKKISSLLQDCLRGIELADSKFMESGKIDILLGANIYAKILTEGILQVPNKGLVAQRTKLGWILFGEIPSIENMKDTGTSSTLSTFTAEEAADVMLNKQIEKFWEEEELLPKRRITKEESECELVYSQTHKRLDNGSYQVKLPFKNGGKPQLGESRNAALSRFFQVERKLERDPNLKALYVQCMKEYIDFGHMVPVGENIGQNKDLRYYLPHHAVIKESSTTKLRVVFDASAKTTNGKSLNEQMMTGPVLQPKLFSTLMKWRKHKYAFNADIEKMYRMIRIHPEDKQYQTIFWRESKNEPLREYELITVTFGTTAAPYLAIKTVQQLAVDDGDKFPVGSKTLSEDLYVDDVLSGADSISDALTLQQELIKLLKGGGFHLRKWAANHTKLLEDIPSEDREIELPLKFEEGNEIKALGIQWHPALDYFSFSFKEDSISHTAKTKRQILSEVAKLFDPLGWIAPSVIKAKILIQSLWRSGCSWDEDVPINILTEWMRFKKEMHHFKEIKIPRWVNLHPEIKKCQIHGFSDASIQAYAAVVYILVTDVKDQMHSMMIMSKTRVAKIKSPSLPRLELCGAVLLSKLIAQVKTDMQLDNLESFSWSDSKIVLAWIKGDPNRWRTYVANRVVEIQENSKNNSWRYVPTKQNPADMASRGIMPSALINNNLWWNGPPWLVESQQNWPVSKSIYETEEDSKPNQVLLTTEQDEFVLLRKYSCFDKLIRITAYCRRLIGKKRSIQSYPSVNEMKWATIAIIRSLQKQIFATEYKSLQSGKEIMKGSFLLKLNPFMDKDGVIRVGGRIEHSDLPYDMKHPIILPSKHHITKMIVNKYHKITLHGGAQLVLNTIRTKYWIINGSSTVKSVIHQCVTCARYRHHDTKQIMGNLPPERVIKTRPFENTGLDYAGPIELKMSKFRGAKMYKGYICIFICMATKAIHIEAVSDLTSEAFLAAFKRFTSRRGLCANLYSDNGTNFVGAEKILKKELVKAIKEANEKASIIMANKGIKWHFNPPLAPHFGGLWEAGVKSIKYHFKRIIGSTVLTFEELSTVLAQIEAAVNSRPLCSLSNDPTTLDVLTPGHFLVGKALLAPPEADLTDHNVHTLKRWQLVQQLQQTFWKRWSLEYVTQLQQRHKWNTNQPNVTKGQIVLLKEEKVPPCKWVLGIIEEVHPGSDGKTRVVSVKTQSSTFRRAITKICPLSL